jgi:acyl carrier protein
MTSPAQTIRAFIVENFLFGDTTVDLADHVSLIEAGIIDSTGVLELVGFVESTFGLTVADSDIVPANFDSIGRLAAYVEAKTAVIEAA